MTSHTPTDDPLGARLDAQFEALHRRLDALDRRIEQRLAEMKARQDEDLLLLKALSCQVRGRAERVDRALRRRD